MRERGVGSDGVGLGEAGGRGEDDGFEEERMRMGITAERIGDECDDGVEGARGGVRLIKAEKRDQVMKVRRDAGVGRRNRRREAKTRSSGLPWSILPLSTNVPVPFSSSHPNPASKIDQIHPPLRTKT